MFLAAALLLQVLATPKYSLSITYVDSSTTAAAAPSAPAGPAAKDVEASSETAAPSPDSSIDVDTDSAVAYMPGRLVPQPVGPETTAESSSLGLSPEPLFVVNSNELEIQKRRHWEQRQKKIWLGLAIAQSGAASFDAWSTRRVISSGAGQELNPMLRPFAGNDSLYAAIQVAPLLLDYIGRRMLTSELGWARHTWWIPQAVGTAVSLAGGGNNLAVRGAF